MSAAAPRPIRFTLNGAAARCSVAPHETLVDVLRDRFALYGPRESCGQGLCGCCTVLVNGEPVSGCLYLAVFADGTEIVTVEGLANGDKSIAGTGGLYRGGRVPVRLLHARLRADDHHAAEGAP